MSVFSFGLGVPFAKAQSQGPIENQTQKQTKDPTPSTVLAESPAESTQQATPQNDASGQTKPFSKPPSDLPPRKPPSALNNSNSQNTRPISNRPSPKPPRIDGAYLGPSLHGFILLSQIDALNDEQVLGGGSAWIRAGEVVFPWLSIGIQAGGGMAYRDPQKATQWGFLIEFGFYPTPRIPWSLRAGFGTGGGAIRDPRKPNKRFGYGGAMFHAGARYEWFPLASRNRATRAGGWAIGPEVGWIAFPPSAKGKDMAHSPYLSLTTSFYFGR